MSESSEDASQRSRRARVALLVLAVLLIWAGLQPFDFARPNGVSAGSTGLRFEQFGLAISESAFRWTAAATPAAMTIEVWLSTDAGPADDTAKRTWLVLVDDTRLTPLGFRQEGADLVVWDAVTNPGGDRWSNDRRVRGVLTPGRQRYLAVTSGDEPPKIYVDGQVAAVEGGHRIPFARPGEPFAGTLVIGSGPPWEVGWSGEIAALALWSRVLTPAETAARADPATMASGLLLPGTEGLVGAYRFGGLVGEWIADRSGHSNDLLLPAYFRPPKRTFLAPVDLTDWAAPWYALDVLLNVGGFIVFGFLLVMSLGDRHGSVGIVMLATLIGFCSSLTFEVAQAYMVSRSSTIQDLILNTVGTLVGALAAQWLDAARRRARP